MNAAEINDEIRRLLVEERARRVSSDDLTKAQTDAINLLANLLVAAAPEYFEKKVSLAPANTNTPVFTLPSDNLGLKRVWDYDGDAADVSGTADNGSGAIRLTHDGTFTDEDIVNVHDVVGTTEANGIWQVDYVDATHIDLVGSTYTNGYTSGGRIFIEQGDTYKYPIERRSSKFQTAESETKYFTREDDIIVDDPEFENDLIILYRYLPSTLAEIPTRMHLGIPGFGAMVLMDMPPRADAKGQEHHLYNARKKNYNIAESLWNQAQKMAMEFSPIMESDNISNETSVKKWL